ncbi:unnamed protein product [Ceratitis capitata]|uniref:(Mediterranean fruit fly) hypothetical protein n=1 Tax=Ceratitis capitata TaxID=7213 RepID=A0A811VGN3_CERCA|nr:unnamed protein product [Ceratitis capitata]
MFVRATFCQQKKVKMLLKLGNFLLTSMNTKYLHRHTRTHTHTYMHNSLCCLFWRSPFKLTSCNLHTLQRLPKTANSGMAIFFSQTTKATTEPTYIHIHTKKHTEQQQSCIRLPLTCTPTNLSHAHSKIEGKKFKKILKF